MEAALYEYLHTSYEDGDRDFVDGTVEERNLGERDHARLTGLILKYLMDREKEWKIYSLPEQRVQVSATRFRVPDITICRYQPEGSIVTEPPLAVIEILSPADTMRKMEWRIADYRAMGIECIWLVDPTDRSAWLYRDDRRYELPDGILEHPEMRIPLRELGE